jgi:hypothetical protein
MAASAGSHLERPSKHENDTGGNKSRIYAKPATPEGAGK